MKKKLLTLTTVITTTAAGISLYIATLPNPSDAQINLANTTNTITIAGATAIFGLLDDHDDQGQDNQNS
jgi:hypothetical protein